MLYLLPVRLCVSDDMEVSSQTRVGSIETIGRVSQSLQVLDLDLLLRNVELNGGHVDIFVDRFIANLWPTEENYTSIDPR